MGLSFVTTKLNMDECNDFWRYCRDNNMYPNQEFVVPNGRARGHLELIPTNNEIMKIKSDILKMDREEYGYDWLPFKPLTANGCLQTLYSLYVDSLGYVKPCAAIQNDLVNNNSYSLKDSMNHPFLQLAMNIDKHIEGECGHRKFNNECIG